MRFSCARAVQATPPRRLVVLIGTQDAYRHCETFNGELCGARRKHVLHRRRPLAGSAIL